MKKFLPIIFLAGTLNCVSQSYTITPAKTVTFTAPAFNVTINDIYMVNTTSSTLSLTWERISINVPAGWDYSMCDLGTCHGGIPQGPNTMNIVAVADSGFLGLNIDPANIPGTGEVKVFVYETGNKPNGDTLTWKITSAVGVEEITSNTKGIKIYPNPATNVLNIKAPGIHGGNISDVLGRTIMTLDLKGEDQIDVSILPKGFYFLNLEATDRKLFKRIIIE
jgi:hypothetical protein